MHTKKMSKLVSPSVIILIINIGTYCERDWACDNEIKTPS